MAQNLTGIWHGLYSYPRFEQPVYFVATLISFANSFSGTTHEAVEGRSGAPLQLFASLEGVRDGTTVTFTKRYDGSHGWTHKVEYEGDLSADALEIEGTWSIPCDWTGRFLMIRNPGATEKAVRNVFEKV
jgi:hypothetical protein